MLSLIIPSVEGWDENKEEFVELKKEQKLILEHSLVSISKWESKWHKPFLSKEPKTLAETIDYVKCMTITQNVPDEVYNRLRNEHIQQVSDYIEDSMSATWFREDNLRRRNNGVITSELIYYWMVALNIPWNCEKWHLNRLLTLIRICNEENQPKKKRTRNRQEFIDQRRMENEARKKKWNTKG